VRARSPEGHPSGEDEEPHATQAVEVAPGVHFGPPGLLGAHELGRPQHFPGVGPVLLFGRHGDAEVRDHRSPRFPVQEDGVGLDVPVDDSLEMGITQGPCHLPQEADRLGSGEGAPLPDPVAEGPPFHMGHGEEDEALRFVHGVDGHDVGVGEAGRIPGLTEEAFLQARSSCHLRLERLQGHHAVQSDFPRQKDDAHPAPPQFPLQGIPSRRSGLESEKPGCWMRGLVRCHPGRIVQGRAGRKRPPPVSPGSGPRHRSPGGWWFSASIGCDGPLAQESRTPGWGHSPSELSPSASAAGP